MSSISYPKNKNNKRCLQTFKASSGGREHADTDLGTTMVAIPIAQYSYKIRKEITGQIETFSKRLRTGQVHPKSLPQTVCRT